MPFINQSGFRTLASPPKDITHESNSGLEEALNRKIVFPFFLYIF
jgi:hypothetical protein